MISTLVRETSFYSGQWLMSSPITSQSAKHKKLWMLSSNESSMLLPPTPPLHHHQGTLKKSGRKCESWQLMKGAMKCWLRIMRSFLHTSAYSRCSTYTRSTQDPASQNPNTNGKGPQVPCVTGKYWQLEVAEEEIVTLLWGYGCC